MSNQTNSTEDHFNHLKKTFEETFEDVSSAKDFKKIVDRLQNQLQRARQEEEQKLRPLLDGYRKMEPSNFRSIREELAKRNESLRQIADEADQYKFEALCEEEREIIDNADKNPRVKCHHMSYEFFLRKRDPKICLFLAIFQENAVLRKRFLIYWWIGEGLVPDEDEGERVFQELLDLHLLLPYRTDKRPRVSKCQVFPGIRYMLISLATKKENLLMLKDDKRPRFDPTNSRRICLIAEDHTNLAREWESKFPDLRTIFNVNERDLGFQPDWLSKLKRLVVLQLGRWQVSPTHHIEVRDESFLTGLKALKHLKYLSLRGISRITSLPQSIRELVSLQILDLKACHNLETLPAAIASLEMLTHLDVSECYLLESLPKGLDKLTSLQVLKGFIIGSSLKTPIRIKHLTSLENLKRLSIHIGSEATIHRDEFDKLMDLKILKCLKISWGKAVVEKYTISFPPELKKLDLEGIPHDKKPEWLKPGKLEKLETLYIKGGKLSNLLEDEGEKWRTVKYLVLMHTKMPPIKKETLRSMFPSFQYAKQVQRKPEIFIEYQGQIDQF